MNMYELLCTELADYIGEDPVLLAAVKNAQPHLEWCPGGHSFHLVAPEGDIIEMHHYGAEVVPFMLGLLT